MGAWARSTKHAGGHYRRAFGWIGRPVKAIEAEAHHLHDIEQTGESGETPYIAVLGLLLFLGPIFLTMLGIALVAYYVIA